MKVLLVHNAYGKRSGEEVVVDFQQRLLEFHGHQVARFERSSAGLDENPGAKVRAFFTALGNDEAVRDFEDHARRFRPDVVHVHNLYPWISPAVLPACRALGLPVVMTVHNYRLLCPNGLMFSHGEVCERCAVSGEHWCVLRNCEGSLPKSIGYALRNHVARRRRWYRDGVDRYAVLTAFQRDKLADHGFAPERMALLPNAVPLPAEQPAGDAPGGSVGFVGRVSREKGVSVLLQAMSQIDAPCRVAGAFDPGSPLLATAPGNVNFLGMLDPDGLARLYDDLRMVVAPSICYEGFPMAIVEAMARGRPVVASRIGGIPEIVDDGVTGLLFEPGNAEDLADKIRYLWERPDLCREMGAAARAKVEREYSEARYYERLMAIYRDAMAVQR